MLGERLEALAASEETRRRFFFDFFFREFLRSFFPEEFPTRSANLLRLYVTPLANWVNLVEDELRFWQRGGHT